MHSSDRAPLPKNPTVRSFVLRIRTRAEDDQPQAIIDLEDVQDTRSWRFSSLDDAFEQVRISTGLAPVRPGPGQKPH